MEPVSVYLHIPFCRHRCGYCDFNTYAGLDNLIPEYVHALCREIELSARSVEERLPVHTIFFGGGTPSLLPASELEKIFTALQSAFVLQPNIEITLEANPGIVPLGYLQDIRSLGINRLSLGMQSANLAELRLLERRHQPEEVERVVNCARVAGFDQLNLDLIFGLPNQTVAKWEASLDQALALQPEHLALYALTIEHGTPMERQVARGTLPEPDPDLAADMYELASKKLAQVGLEQYEISNWAIRDASGALLSSRHNLQYWYNLPYLGFGAGAHGYIAQVRTSNVLSPPAYIERCMEGNVEVFPHTPATLEAHVIDREAEIAETMMMGLRLTQDGVSNSRFQARFGQRLEEVFPQQIERLFQLRMLEWAGDKQDILRLTEQGRLLGNQVFVEFI